MKVKDLRAGACAAALLAAALFSAPATANTEPEPGFAALQNVEAQSLTAAEMQAIAGELNAYDIAAQLFALAAKYAAFPKLSAFYASLANYFYANAVQINATFAKFNLLTPCTSTLCP